jgi:hypothetical protein
MNAWIDDEPFIVGIRRPTIAPTWATSMVSTLVTLEYVNVQSPTPEDCAHSDSFSMMQLWKSDDVEKMIDASSRLI